MVDQAIEQTTELIHLGSVEAGDEITPEITGLYNWVNDNQTLGFGLFGAYAERYCSSNS